jgi:TPR repeat protein
MSLISRILIALFLSGAAQAQSYRWSQYENQLRKLSAEQLQATIVKAQSGDVDAEMLLAVGYRAGIVLSKDKKEYVTWLQRAAEHGSPDAQFELSGMYHHGNEFLTADPKAMVTWLQRAAEQGHVVAQHNLGSYYLVGYHVPRDLQKGEMWLLKSAEAGFAHAQFLLGQFYLDGRGGQKQPDKGEFWLRKAAEQGHSMALADLAKYYSTLEGAPRDPEFVEMILLRGAEQGGAAAQYQLGRMYLRGFVGRKDTGKASEWFALAADKKYAPAAYALGQMYENSDGVPIDLQRAMQSYLQAAELGYSPAIFAVGEMYRRGRGVTLDVQQAYRWFSIGALMRSDDSAAAQKRLESQLNAEDQKRILAEAQDWLRSHPEASKQKPGDFRYFSSVVVSDDPPGPPRGPSTEEERTKARKLVAAIEADPLSEESKQAREWLIPWMAEIPDFFFIGCDLFANGKGKGPDYRYAQILSMQVNLGGAAYLVHNPEQRKEQLVLYEAGLQSALNAYQSILLSHPDEHWPLLDGLLQQRSGGLQGFVHAKANQNCR